MLPSMELKTFKQADRSALKKEIESLDIPENIRAEWLEKLASAFDSDFPGKPDEFWRRIDYGDWKLDTLPMVNAFLEYEDTTGLARIYSIADCPGDLKEDFQNRYNKSYAQFREKYLKRANDIRDNRFSDMISAFSANALAVHIPPETDFDQPIRIRLRHPGGAHLALPIVYILADKRSRADVVLEIEGGDHGSVMMVKVRTIVDESAQLKLLTVDQQSRDSVSVSFHETWIHSDSTVESDFISPGSRSSIQIHEHVLLGKGAKTSIYGLTNTEAEQLTGTKVVTYHHAPKTISDFQVQSVVRGKGHSVYVGNIQIPADSQKCEGFQENNHLLLDKSARAETLPQLEIIANDVKCSHGATLSDVDPLHLFYLQSRGLDADEARRLMIRSFYNKMLGKMSMLTEFPAIRNEMNELFHSRLGLDMSDKERDHV